MTSLEQSIKFLVVDDDDTICNSIKSKIMRLPYSKKFKVDTSNSAMEALLLYKRGHHNIIITDINMPCINGFTLVKEIRQLGNSCYIFALSGYDDYNFVRTAFINGVDDYMLKPLSMNELDQKVRGVLTDTDKIISQQEKEQTNDPLCSNVMNKAIEFMQLNIKRNITMKDAADYVNISYNHFSKLFNQVTGMTFPAYMLKLKIENSCVLLKDPALRINQIAEKVGYDSVCAFSRDFKKHTGLSPSDYRLSITV